jgi:hypothetical protein
MTGYQSKKAAAQAKLDEDDDTQVYGDALTIAYQSGYYDGKKAAQPAQEPVEYWNAVEGWVKIDEVRQHFDTVGCGTIYKTAGENRVPVYTHPPAAAQREWVDLTQEEIENCYGGEINNFARAVLAKSKEKNNG